MNSARSRTDGDRSWRSGVAIAAASFVPSKCRMTPVSATLRTTADRSAMPRSIRASLGTATDVGTAQKARDSAGIRSINGSGSPSCPSIRWWTTTAVYEATVKAVSRRRRWPKASLYSGLVHRHNRHRRSRDWPPVIQSNWRGLGFPLCCRRSRHVLLAAIEVQAHDYLFAPVAGAGFLSADVATEAKCTAVAIVLKRRDGPIKGRPAVGTRRPTAGGRCMRIVAADIAPAAAA